MGAGTAAGTQDTGASEMNEDSTEKRKTQRHRVLKGARIVFNYGRSTIACTIRNISETGALLKVASPVGVPDQFMLVQEIPRDSIPCRTVRRSVDLVAVVFAPMAQVASEELSQPKATITEQPAA